MLLADAVKFSDKAEATGNVRFCVKGNSFRRTAESKRKDLSEIASEIKVKERELKNM
jgi:hypothetical protein